MKRLGLSLLLILLTGCVPLIRGINAVGAHGVTLEYDDLDTVISAAETPLDDIYAQLEGENFQATDPEDNCQPKGYYLECYRESLAAGESWRIEVDSIDPALELYYYADARFLVAGLPGRVQAE